MSSGSGKCWNCGVDLNELEYGRQDTCRSCGKPTRVCLNCEFYDTNYNNECRENQADRVVDKDRSNFCDYFKPNPNLEAKGGKSQDDLKAAAEALFKKS